MEDKEIGDMDRFARLRPLKSALTVLASLRLVVGVFKGGVVKEIRRRGGRGLVLLIVPILSIVGLAPLAAASNHAFITNVGANVNINQLAGNQSEGTIAINPVNPQQMFAASNPGTTAANSTNGGQTWATFTMGTGPGGDGLPNSCCDNVARFDQFGNLFLVYLGRGADGSVGTADDTVELLLSQTGGAQGSFTVLQQIDVGNVDQPSVAVGGGNVAGTGSVWVTWNDGGTIRARGAQVTGLGAVGAFTAEQAAPGSAAVSGQFGDVAVGPNGQVVVTYQSNTQIFVNTDADGVGAGGFGAQVTVTGTNVAKFDSIPAQFSRTIDAEANLAWDRSGGANNGRVYLVYTDEVPDESHDTDIFVRFSNDNGANWSAAVQVNDDAGTNSQFLPNISLDQTTGFLAVTWHDARNDTGAGAGDTNGTANDDAQFWGAFSVNGGAGFRPNVQISGGTSNEVASANGIDFGDYTWSDFVGGNLFPIWADNSNSTGDNPNGALSRFDMYTARVHFEPNDPPVVNAGPDVSGNEGSAISLDGTVTQADEPGLDPFTTAWSVSAGAPCSFANATAIDTTITCTDNGTFTVTLTADDGDNPPVSDSAVVTVANVPPTLSITLPVTGDLFQIGTPVNLVAPFTDPGSSDIHTCAINWDDGTTDTFAASGNQCSTSHLFASAGVYTIGVTVTDDDGGSDTESVMVVVFDPSAGFVTGGGWIDSPPGAYTVNPVLSGKAVFGFVSKYHKGATTPSGETEFQFQMANFKFHSETYQWLVVAGARAQYKGTGEVNGVPGFGFLLTATDGALPGGGGVDKFRIKIWDTVTNTVIYDNVAGASEDIDSANPQPIAHGSIVIQK